MAPRSQNTSWSADEALELLYAAHWRRLVRLAFLLVHDVGTAEEIVQECFVAVHGRWSRLHDVQNVIVADSSVFVTSAGLNPSLTITAIALRVADRIATTRGDPAA